MLDINKMCEELLPGFFKIKITLPNSPLKYLNSYVICGKDRSLIVDTGFNRPECLNESLKAINELKLDLNRTDFFITHMHSDHVGLLGQLVQPASTVYFNYPEKSNFDSDNRERWRELRQEFFIRNGYPEKEYQLAIANNPSILYGLKSKINFTPLKENSIIQYGSYHFNCVETPGHSPGHMCLYEPERKVLIAGDHILNDITPNIAWWPEMENPLGQYLKSLDKVDALDCHMVLPGHRTIDKNYHDRIKEIKEHHQRRLSQVIQVLKNGEQTAFQIASKLSWDIKYESWDKFPPGQKYFAVGEALAHIKYLELSGRIGCLIKDSRYYYFSK